MKVHSEEILLYYDPSMSIAKKTLAYAKSISQNVNMVEYHREHFTPTVWRQILGLLNMEPKQLVNKANPYYQLNLKGRHFETDDWINILTHQPDLIRAPIAIKGNFAVLVDNPTDIYRLK
jgi:arsenate reductase